MKELAEYLGLKWEKRTKSYVGKLKGKMVDVKKFKRGVWTFFCHRDGWCWLEYDNVQH